MKMKATPGGIVPLTDEEEVEFNAREMSNSSIKPIISITMRQARLMLLQKGLLDAVNIQIANMPQAAQIEWEYATEVKRDYDLVLQIQVALGMTDDAMDSFFNSAKNL